MSGQGQGLPPDQIENCPHPKDAQTLFGHEVAEQSFLQAITAKKMHHAWMIEGPKGCGKATLAYRMARRLAGAMPDLANGILGAKLDDPINRQISAGSYPDVKVIINGWNDRTRKWRNEIIIDQIREIGHLFANRAASDGWRVCIIDCADNLNRNAANALLKTLEEPPARGLLILICHQPGRLLPTITSRCRSLKLRAPGIQIAQKIAMDCGAQENDALFAAKLAGGCPGRAVEIANVKGKQLWDKISQIFDGFPKLDQADIHDLANQLALKKQAQSLNLFLDLLSIRTEREVQQLAISKSIQAAAPWLKAVDANRVLREDLYRINLDPAMTIHQLIRNLQSASQAAQNKMERP